MFRYGTLVMLLSLKLSVANLASLHYWLLGCVGAPAGGGQGPDQVVCAVGGQHQVGQVGHALGRREVNQVARWTMHWGGEKWPVGVCTGEEIMGPVDQVA